MIITIRNNQTNKFKTCKSMQDALNKKSMLSAKGLNISIVIKYPKGK